LLLVAPLTLSALFERAVASLIRISSLPLIIFEIYFGIILLFIQIKEFKKKGKGEGGL
jgi:hypothetical protein